MSLCFIDQHDFPPKHSYSVSVPYVLLYDHHHHISFDVIFHSSVCLYSGHPFSRLSVFLFLRLENVIIYSSSFTHIFLNHVSIEQTAPGLISDEIGTVAPSTENV